MSERLPSLLGEGQTDGQGPASKPLFGLVAAAFPRRFGVGHFGNALARTAARRQRKPAS